MWGIGTKYKSVPSLWEKEEECLLSRVFQRSECSGLMLIPQKHKGETLNKEAIKHYVVKF